MGAEGGAAADLYSYDLTEERDGGYRGSRPRNRREGKTDIISTWTSDMKYIWKVYMGCLNSEINLN